MPQVIPAIVAWAGSTAFTVAGVAVTYGTLVQVAVVAGSIAYSSAENRRIRNQLSGLGADRGRDIMSRDPLAYRRLIYGQIRTTGPILYMATEGVKNENLHLVIAIAGHECDSLGEITVDNDELVQLDSSGNATGKYTGHITVKKFHGSSSQAASAELQAAFPGIWTSNHKLSGIAYLHVKFKYNVELFPNGMQTIKCLVRGKKVWDPRVNPADTTIRAWSCNSALCAADFLNDSNFGRGIAWSRINTAALIEAANICEESIGLANSFTRQVITVLGGRNVEMTTQAAAQLDGMVVGMRVSGTNIPAGARITYIDAVGPVFYFSIDTDCTANGSGITATFGNHEYRYEAHGTVTSDQLVDSALLDILGSMAGHVTDMGGIWTIRAGAYRTPTVDLNESHMIGTMSMVPRVSRKDNYNGVKGTYISPFNLWVASDFPPVKNDTYMGWDGNIRLWKDIYFPFTISPAAAQRLAKIDLERGRQQIQVEQMFKLHAFECMCFDTVRITKTELGWVNKEFEVTNWKLSIVNDGGQASLAVTLSLRETAVAVWSWTDGSETVVDIAPNTSLPNPSVIPTPTSFSATSSTIVQADGSILPRMVLSWATPNNIFVEQGGFVAIEYKRSADSVWTEYNTIRGDLLADLVIGLTIGESYDFRIRFISQLGVHGAYTSTTTIQAGDVTVPATPTGLAAVAGTGKLISLDWDDNTEPDISEYRIYRHTANVFASALLIAEVSASRFVDADVNYSTQYYYWIKAVDTSENASVETTSVTATTSAPPAGIDTTPPSNPAAPTLNTNGIYTASDGATIARLVFNLPAMPAGGVNLNLLYRRSGSTGWQIADQSTTGGGTSAIDDLNPGVSYEVACQALSAYGYGSAIVAATGSPFTTPSDTSAPSAPTSLAAVTGTGKAISLTWNNVTATDFSEYGVYRNTTNNFGTATKIAETRSNRFVDIDVTIGTEYFYWVTAYDRSENQSGASAVASGIPGTIPAGSTDATPPTAPTAATFSTSGVYESGDGSIFAYISLSIPALPTLAKYQNVLYKKTAGGGDWLIAAQLTNTGTQIVKVDDLVPGISYDFAVVAISAFAIASTVVGCTGSPFTAPNKTASAGGFSSVAISSPSVGIPPVIVGGGVAYGAVASFTCPTDRDLIAIEIKAVFNNSDSDTGYSWFIEGAATDLYRITASPGENKKVSFYSTSLIPGYCFIRSINATGVVSGWTAAGNLNSVASLSGGTIINQNTTTLAVTGITTGNGASQRRVLARQPIFTTVSLTGGAASETVNMSLTNFGFSSRPDALWLQVANWDKILIRYDEDDSSSTNAVLRLTMSDGSNLPALTITITGEAIEY